jgi:tetratricopeptide (TPR) repeat protein
VTATGVEPVGRVGVRQVLHATVARTTAGPGSFVLLTGEPGIGKTTLLADAAAQAQRLGVRAAWGWGWRGEGAPAYWPWRQVLRELGLPSPSAEDRFQLFDEVSTAVLAESRVQPVVLLFDDLHWADESSLLLLEYLARRLPAGALAILGAQRDVTPEAPYLPAGALVIPLRGLSAAAIAEMTGDPPAAQAIHRRSGGNPFLVQQLMWLGDAGVPPAASELLRQRLSGLDLQVLGAAAVLGPTFTGVLLAKIVPDADVDTALAAAARARVIVQTGPGEYRFAHDLFWELLTAQPAAVHRRVAEALVGQGTHDPAEIAAHFVRADPGSAEAYAWSVRAGEEADRRLAYEDAVRHWRDATAAATERDRAEALLRLARAHSRAGGLDAAREEFLAAARLSRARQDGGRLAEAALGLHDLGSRPRWPADELVALLAEAEAVAPEPIKVRVTAALARVLAWHAIDPSRAVALAEGAVARARALGDPAVLAECLLAQHNVFWVPGKAVRRHELAGEIAAIGRARGDTELELEAHLLAATDLLELADARFREEIGEFLRLAEASAQPRLRYAALVRRGFLATLAGRLGEAERFVESAHHLGTECAVPAADDVHADQLWRLRFEQGRLSELAGSAATVFSDPHSAAALGFQALTLIAAGRRDEAEEVVAPLLDRPPTTGVGHNSLLDCAFATELVVALGHVPTAKWLYEVFEPHAGTTIVSGAMISFAGAVDDHLGRLAVVLGRRAEAQRHFRAAQEIYERLGIRPAPSVAKGQFTREGPLWTLGFAGRTVKVKDAKGLRDLAGLIAAPGQEITAVLLLGAGPMPGGDEVLDETARRQVRARLLDLEEDIAEADEWHDPERAARARAERDALLHELAGSLGLGGRARRLGDDAERARKAVTARIRDAIGKIHAVHPALGDHLGASVTTGTYCSYTPAEPIAWRI